MASRGINFVSNIDYKWHLTCEILKVSAASTCSDITQACRLFGKYDDSIPTRLYCLQKDAMSLKQSYYLQQRLLEGADLHEISEVMPTLCAEIKVFVGHIPKRKTSGKKRMVFNMVESVEKQYGEVHDEEEEKMEDDEEWGLRYIRSNLRKGNRSSIRQVIEFFRDEIENGFNGATSKEDIMQALISINWAHLTAWNQQYRYTKVLVPTNGDQWRINPLVIRILQE